MLKFCIEELVLKLSDDTSLFIKYCPFVCTFMTDVLSELDLSLGFFVFLAEALDCFEAIFYAWLTVGVLSQYTPMCLCVKSTNAFNTIICRSNPEYSESEQVVVPVALDKKTTCDSIFFGHYRLHTISCKNSSSKYYSPPVPNLHVLQCCK